MSHLALLTLVLGLVTVWGICSPRWRQERWWPPKRLLGGWAMCEALGESFALDLTFITPVDADVLLQEMQRAAGAKMSVPSSALTSQNRSLRFTRQLEEDDGDQISQPDQPAAAMTQPSRPGPLPLATLAYSVSAHAGVVLNRSAEVSGGNTRAFRAR